MNTSQPKVNRAKLLGTLAVSVIVLTAMYLFLRPKTKPGQIEQLSAAFIHPPLQGVNVDFADYKINSGHDTLIICASGTEIAIPKTAFLNKAGRAVEGDVRLRFREFRDPVDFFASGIPMTYDSAGMQYQFESAGMFEITAYRDTEQVFANPQAPIQVNFASGYAGNNYTIYYLDTLERKWNYITEDIVKNGKGRQQDSTIAEPTPEPKQTSILIPVKANKKAYHFTVDFDKHEFPELAAFEKVQFEVEPGDKSFDPKLAAKNWSDVKLERNPDGTHITVVFSDAYSSVTFRTRPVISASDFKKYEKERKKKIENEEKALKESQRKYDEKRGILTRINTNEVNNDILNTEETVKRVFLVNKFGIWNSDCPQSMPTGARVFARFKSGLDSAKIQPERVYLVEKGRNALFSYYSAIFPKFTFNPGSTNIIWTVTGKDEIGIVNADDFVKTIKWMKEHKKDTADFHFHISSTMVIKNIVGLKKLFNI